MGVEIEVEVDAPEVEIEIEAPDVVVEADLVIEADLDAPIIEVEAGGSSQGSGANCGLLWIILAILFALSAVSCLVYAFMCLSHIGLMIGMLVGCVINGGLSVLFFCCWKKGKSSGNSDANVALMGEVGGSVEVEMEVEAPTLEVEVELEAPEIEVEVEIEAPEVEIEVEIEAPEVEIE